MTDNSDNKTDKNVVVIERGTNYCDEWDWENLIDIISQEMAACVNYTDEIGEWFIEVQNFGWQNTNGVQYINTMRGDELLKAILPNTECTFNIYRNEHILKLQNFHHDSCTGREWYHIYPCFHLDYTSFIVDNDLLFATSTHVNSNIDFLLYDKEIDEKDYLNVVNAFLQGYETEDNVLHDSLSDFVLGEKPSYTFDASLYPYLPYNKYILTTKIQEAAYNLINRDADVCFKKVD